MDNVYVTRWGTSGPRVILIHGSAQGSTVGGDRHFARQQVLGERGWQVLVPDRPGHGRSPSPGRGDDAEADAVWVAEMMADGAHLVGHSFGGAVALAAAERRPEATISLTLIEPSLEVIATNNLHVGLYFLRAGLAMTLARDPRKRVEAFAKITGVPPEIGGSHSPEEARKMSEGISRLRLPNASDVVRELRIVREHGIPLLLVSGGWNKAITVACDAAAQLGGGRHEIIPSPHHFPNLVSDDFNRLLEAHMRNAEDRRAAATLQAP